MAPGLAVGIDLGTTFSVVSVWRKGKVEVLANDDGNRITPSVVAFLNGESYVGQAAEEVEAPVSSRVFDAKRLIGRSWDDEHVQTDKKSWPFDVVARGGAPRIQVAVSGRTRQTFAPEEISAMVLQNLKKTAEDALDQTVTKAVITVPAYFNERQRQATEAAGKIAGLEVIGMINEPTAAAIAYGLTNVSSTSAKKTVFIYDLGGGTFDVSVMVIEGSEFKVIASGGDTHLGGQDFDLRLLDHCLKDIKLKHDLDLRALKDDQSLRDLRRACELTKRKLSKLTEVPLSVFLTRHDLGYNTRITRAFFQNLCLDLFKKTMTTAQEVLLDSKLPRSAIDDVVLVGGSTRIPKVRTMLSDFFGGKELKQSIHPDEAVAYGAAVQAATLTGDKAASKMVRLKDVTPLSLGVNVVGGRFSVVIPKNSPIPCKSTETYCTFHDYQPSVSSKIYQGERSMTADNHCLNKEFRVPVPVLPAGQATVAVTFEIDANGLLTVTAMSPTLQKPVQVKISRGEAYLSEKDIQDMITKAKQFQRADADELSRVEELLRQQRLL